VASGRKRNGKEMKLVCSKRNINNPKIEQISKEILKLDNKDYFHSTLYFNDDKSKYIRVHSKSTNQYILIYCDGLSEDYLQEEKSEFSHDEIIDLIKRAMENDFSWVDDFSWITFKRGEPLYGIFKSICKTVIVSSIFIIASIVSIKTNIEFIFGLFVISFPFLFYPFSLIKKNNKSDDVSGAQIILNNLWYSLIFPATFYIIARNVYLNNFWTVLSSIFVFFFVIEIFVLINYSFTKPFSGKRENPVIDLKKKRKKTVYKIIFRSVLIVIWLISWRYIEINI